MDLVHGYSSASSSSPEASPALPPSNPPVKLVTGTVETITLSDAAFTSLQRQQDQHVITSNVRPAATTVKSHIDQARKRPPSSVQITPQKRPRSPSASASDPTASSRAHEARPRTQGPFVPSTQLHVRAKDYRNRSWLAPSTDARSFEDLETYTPYIPKRATHELDAHTGAVSVVRLLPPYGHMLLSTGLDDGCARVWDVTRARIMRTYRGHSKGIRDTVLTQNGATFLTAGYDRAVRLWDTETGRVKGSYSMSGMPFCVQFYPRADGVEFLAGCADKKVVQIDTRDSSNVVQTYDQHMGAVNSISFVDDDRRFVSSSDDKVLRLWEYGVPVVIRHISDPGAHSMPVTMLHPNRKWLACQSMDNAVRLFSARDKFKPNNKKSFKGHLVAGYACGLASSPDGRFLASGDSMGRMFFWDWKTSRLFRALQAHKGVCFSLAWHFTRPSFVISGGWDGKVKFWD